MPSTLKFFLIFAIVIVAVVVFQSTLGTKVFPDLYANKPAVANNGLCNCVAFRLDDIQDFWEVPAQQQVISAFNDSGTPLTIGVIGNALKDDGKHIKFLKGALASGNIELANHGWIHEDFTKVGNDADQAQLMIQTNDRILQLFGKTPDVIIMPFNAMNHDTVIAARASGLKYISAYEDTAPKPFLVPDNSTGVIEVPGTLAAGDLDKKTQLWSSFTSDGALQEIAGNVKKYGFSVVVLHFQVFVDPATGKVKPGQIAELKSLIEKTKEKYGAVQLDQLAVHS